MGFLICGIYERRPEMCRKYPERDSYTPSGCTYTFDAEGKRQGFCDPHCQASCCMLPRKDGEPGGAPLPTIAGGLPCKHLQYVEKHPALPNDGQADPDGGGDSGEDRAEPNPLQLVLAEIRGRQRRRDLAASLGMRGGAKEGSGEG